MPSDTIPRRLFETAKKHPRRPAYFVRDAGGWRPTIWETYADEVRAAAKSLIALGFETGSTVAILGFNRPEWAIMDLGCMAAGGAPAGIYTTCSPPEVRYIISHSAAPIVLVENHDQWKKVEAELHEMPALRHVVLMKGSERPEFTRAAEFPDRNPETFVLTWDEFMGKGADLLDASVQERVDALEPDALATLIYTSGTTGPPKGVMLSHRNLSWTARTAQRITDLGPSDVSMSYLPLSHIAEQMFTLHGPITAGSQVYFAESIDKVPDNLKEVQPTVFFGVPRIWEKFYSGISSKLGEAEGFKAKLVGWARNVATQTNQLRADGKEPEGFLSMQYGLANKLIFSKLKPAVGLGRARVCVSGAAPISREILEFFATLDIVVLEVYGQSEDTGPTSFNLPSKFRFGTVGPAIAGVEVKIADDDEILVKGPNVFLGYYKDTDATDATLRDGWLHSGDLGAFSDDGFLSITGRKKDIIITAGGKNITPKNIESSLKNHPLINEAVVIGDRRKYLSCLLTIDPEAGEAWAKEHGVDADELHNASRLHEEIQRAVDETNAKFARVEQIKKFHVLARNLTIEDGELTPTLKVKRNKVAEHFSSEIESMYE
ncbi:MAG: AMP-dependent synthetase/ligase [Myxococcota bacterium]